MRKHNVGDNVYILSLYSEKAHGSGIILQKMIPDPEPNKYRISVDMEQMTLYFEPERLMTETEYFRMLKKERDNYND